METWEGTRWFGLSSAPYSNQNERFANRNRNEPSPEFSLTLPCSRIIHLLSGGNTSRTQTTFKITECTQTHIYTHVHTHIHIHAHAYIFLHLHAHAHNKIPINPSTHVYTHVHVHFCKIHVIMNRQGHNHNWNGNAMRLTRGRTDGCNNNTDTATSHHHSLHPPSSKELWCTKITFMHVTFHDGLTPQTNMQHFRRSHAGIGNHLCPRT